ncbi:MULTISPECIES: DUF3021 domain-containing protein [Lactiplantibacillus]|uniref:DUF3021 domain-containing protein n=2 Tax=Lactiplantibacillus pentosus TaxID=1589 RepID=A0AAP5UPW4_LACPE|nr:MULTISPECIES: DUF3021 domain-containing protein [Lactiplantibacillus]AUI78381.1 hypothetical protein BB562_06660 [Lactiplantibacillus pentosus]MBU7462385.1 DUF3021 domain-containing protein [Lactiplantibacillus pentosus]MBU7464679.1 DUF3021 domain-containing protein [Lactiplantibacillus pentosus]MBU7474255.1 DUF3021 domain-containing protein [Lactiplantibacillus pentosus]MBU7476611.1 DUF3021 domain-containing protein [Lactiplantibacillus pentosus]
MKVSLQRMMIGCGYGAVAYLVIIALNIQPTHPTMRNVVSVLIMSALIGLLTDLFELDRLSYLVALGLHLLGTFGLTISTIWFNHWHTASFWGLFLGCYLILWGIVRFYQFLEVTKINQALDERQKNLNQHQD